MNIAMIYIINTRQDTIIDSHFSRKGQQLLWLQGKIRIILNLVTASSYLQDEESTFLMFLR